MFNNGQEL